MSELGKRPDATGRHAGLWALWSLLFFVLWVLLTGSLVLAELAAGAAAALIAGGVAELVRAQDYRQFRPRLRWLYRARVLPWRILVDCFALFAALWGHLAKREPVRGAFRAFRYTSTGDDARAAAKRALITAAITSTPNTYVVGLDRQRQLILVHQLVPVPRALARDEILEKL